MTPRHQPASAGPTDGASRTHRGALLLRAVAAAAGLALLTGCTVEVVDSRVDTASPTSEETSRDDASATTTPGGTETTDDPAEEPADDASALADDPSGPSDDDSPAPVATPSPPTSTVSCADDGTLVLWQASQAVELTEDCDHVTVAAADVQLTARAITTLEVAAAGVVVHATEIGTLSVAGAGSTVVWDEGSPSITDDGVDNVLVPS